MTDRIEISGLQVARELHDFVDGEVIPGTGIDATRFWAGLSAIVSDLGPRNRELLAKRDSLQQTIDDWHSANGAPSDMAVYEAFLTRDRLSRAGRPGLHASPPTMSIPRSRRSPDRNSSCRS